MNLIQVLPKVQRKQSRDVYMEGNKIWEATKAIRQARRC